LGLSKEQAAKNRLAILASATQLFRERGVDAVGISELMKHAGFTQGGFYNHFASKSALVAEVISAAMAQGAADFSQALNTPVEASTTALHRFVGYYLSQGHRDDIEHGCPVSGFAGDAPRVDTKAQTYFVHGLDDQITIIAALIAESGTTDATGEQRTLRERAISLHCQMVGALILSRSVAQTAPAFSDEILKNAQRDIIASLDQHSNRSPLKRRKA
jgi:TetR/AcrR family transcriptional repressor of nem operon